VMHRLAAQEFSDGGAQHGFAVGGTRIWREAGAFELQFEEALLGLNFAQRDGSTVAELTGPVTELMAAVALSVGLHAEDRSAATEHDAGFVGSFQSQYLGHFGRPEGESGFRGRRGRNF